MALPALESALNKRILIVDDEPDIVELLTYNFKNAGYEVKSLGEGVGVLEIAQSFKPAVILLDIMMPGQDGVETCRQLRAEDSLADAYIIFLTARAEEYTEIAAFDSGADDYITKPIKPRALLKRLDAIFRRSNNLEEADQELKLGDLIIDRRSFTVIKDGEQIVLPKKEFELLFYLAKRPGRVCGREELLKNVWGTDVYVLARTVDVHIRKIREKLSDEYIKTIKGVGYRTIEK